MTATSSAWTEAAEDLAVAATARSQRRRRGARCAVMLALAAGAIALSLPASALALSERSFVGRAQSRPTLSAAGETLSWNAVDPSGYYVLRRTVGHNASEYALIDGVRAVPPAVLGKKVTYAVRGATSAAWSQPVSIAYASALAGSLLAAGPTPSSSEPSPSAGAAQEGGESAAEPGEASEAPAQGGEEGASAGEEGASAGEGTPEEAEALRNNSEILVEGAVQSAAASAETSKSVFVQKPAARLQLRASGNALSWQAIDPTGAYLLERSLPGSPSEYAVVKAIQAAPPVIAGTTVGYRVRPITATLWSNEVSISYPGEGEEGEEEGGREAAVVNAAPTGPAAPAGGWHVAFADGFGRPLGTGAGEDNFWYPNESCCNPAEDVHGNNTNELEVYNSSQVHVGPEGLELIDRYAPGRKAASGGWPEINYVSGAVQDFPVYSPYGYHPFTWEPGHGEKWAFECYCRLPVNTGEVDPGWWSTTWTWQDEFDFFEEWGWESPLLPLTGVVWIYETAGRHIIEANNSLYNLFDPATAFHRYTTVINPDNSVEEYIDGVKQLWLGPKGVLGPPPRVAAGQMSLILSNAIREHTSQGPDPAANFRSGTRIFTIRSVAVYEDAADAGKDVSGGGVAPGTVVAK